MGAKEVTNSYLIDLGKMEYRHAHTLQQQCVAWRLQDSSRPDIFLVTEHLPVFTLGKRGGRESLVVPEEFVRGRGVDIVQTERGGDITYHGPGQLVVYPIINLRQAGLTVKDYVDLLEEVMIRCAADFSLTAARDERNRGIWVGNNKIGSIGIRIRRGVTFHGLALNISIDFEHFSWIQPCGLSGVGVTSIERETALKTNFQEAKERMEHHLSSLFRRRLQPISSSIITGEAA